jgi:hypothetical protein
VVNAERETASARHAFDNAAPQHVKYDVAPEDDAAGPRQRRGARAVHIVEQFLQVLTEALAERARERQQQHSKPGHDRP